MTKLCAEFIVDGNCERQENVNRSDHDDTSYRMNRIVELKVNNL